MSSSHEPEKQKLDSGAPLGNVKSLTPADLISRLPSPNPQYVLAVNSDHVAQA